ncbi:nucleoid occlusion protein [Desulfuribacillus alkaliarsenatis]|uniref:Nucleoid occlusion protein n=1 Tax=Desulfuribacillus alkaliarsenatis TaxID=766136 RepID=A0A1E5G3S7_9FIRM|nr:nucleoid occlusion protein [Desulfuribacillus alkaliarsenatis]OEF97319.1 nucleoid occlusion protein [Desulfuribacillus alkaliarsenatis]
MKEPITRLLGGKWQEDQSERITEIPVHLIDPSPYQPRSVFEDDKLDELCQTIKTHGIIQPIVVRKNGPRYELIAGERRLRAVKKLQLEVIPAIIKNMNDTQAASVALIENLQREGLTSIEEAIAYKKLIDIHGLTQEALAQRLGKGQSTIANKLRLINLPELVQEGLMQRKLTERHARALLQICTEEEILHRLYNDIITRDLTVKQVEDRIKQYKESQNKPKKPKRVGISKDIRIARNTISQSIEMVKKIGMNIDVEETDMDEYYQITIKLPKK